MLKPLFIFEMANNHQGSVEHGKRIIRAMKDAAAPFADRFRFAVKFQYRDLDTFIHPAMRGRADVKNVKRFEDTRLSPEQFAELLACVRESGFLSICTPFDEASAERIKQEGYDFIKIASCSFGDWPLLEAVAATELPVIASGAGAGMDTVRHVVAFFQNRRIPISLMHCVGEYPTVNARMQMNQIDFYHREFPDLTIGFSTHEAPDNFDPVKIAVAKGARIFERHVGVPVPEEGIELNGYSANPEQIRAWIAAAADAFELCGVEGARYVPSEKEASDLAALKRGAFVKPEVLKAGMTIGPEDVYFAFPCQPGQLLAGDFSKYNQITLRRDVNHDDPIMAGDAEIRNSQALVRGYIDQVLGLIKASNAVIPEGSTCDLSHHYGLDKFEETGMALISCVNREYCKKLLVLLPGQKNPEHSHSLKEETFLVLHGELITTKNGQPQVVKRGETLTMERDVPHSLSSEQGCVFEEISTTHHAADSYYEDADKFVHPRKTTVYITRMLLDDQ